MTQEPYLDDVQTNLKKCKWYDNLTMPDKLEVLELIESVLSRHKGLRWKAEAKLLIEKEKSRKLYHACHHAYIWHCGNGTDKAEKECMNKLQEVIELYNIKENNMTTHEEIFNEKQDATQRITLLKEEVASGNYANIVCHADHILGCLGRMLHASNKLKGE